MLHESLNKISFSDIEFLRRGEKNKENPSATSFTNELKLGAKGITIDCPFATKEIIDHLENKKSGYLLNIRKKLIPDYTVHEIIRPSEISDSAFTSARHLLEKITTDCFNGGNVTPEEVALYTLKDGDSMISQFVINDKNNMLEAVFGSNFVKLSLNNRDVTAINLNTALVQNSSRNARINQTITDDMLTRLEPEYVCASTMNPAYVSSFSKSVKEHQYEVINPDDKGILEDREKNLIQSLANKGILGDHLPDNLSIRHEQMKGLQADGLIKSWWSSNKQTENTKFAYDLFNSGKFNPLNGDQLFLIAKKQKTH